ncbi:hypothetical protein KC363_g108 [Hortaea werneckii]|nr:hypothetical protein KC363_g108 [Hortaea werneckii]
MAALVCERRYRTAWSAKVRSVACCLDATGSQSARQPRSHLNVTRVVLGLIVYRFVFLLTPLFPGFDWRQESPVHDLLWRDHIAEGLAHLLAVRVEDEPMRDESAIGGRGLLASNRTRVQPLVIFAVFEPSSLCDIVLGSERPMHAGVRYTTDSAQTGKRTV